MINSENLCMSCMNEIGDAIQCPYCRHMADTPQVAPYLPMRTVVSNRYLVGKLLEFNGDGATYIAWDLTEKRPVKVREFLPEGLYYRKPGDKNVTPMPGGEATFNEYMSDFIELWHRLMRMTGLSALESVIDVFEENCTAYAITEHVETITLRNYLLRYKDGYISWDEARSLFMPVLSTLGMLHTAGIIHRGISPFTLRLGKDRKMRITGFSISAVRTAKTELKSQLFQGYAAVEQYGFEGKQGAWTDIYAFAATLYRALIGSDPIDATERLTNDRLMVPGKFAEQLPAYVINGLINALQILPEDRTHSVEQLRAELSASPVATAADFTAPPPAVSGEPRTVNVEKAPPERKPVVKKQQPVKKKEKSKAQNKFIVLRTALISAIVCLVVFLVIILFAGDKIGLGEEQTTKAPEVTGQAQITVPNFVNRNYGEVKSTAFWTNNFTFESVEEYNDTVTKGYIIAQDIKEGSKVNVGTKIVLTVSLGVQQFELPYVTGMDYDDAKSMLKELNFKVSKKVEENDGSYTQGEVKGVEGLTERKKYPKGTEVVLLVWGEPATEEPVIPDEPATQLTTNVPNSGTVVTTQPGASVPSSEPASGQEQTTGALTPVVTDPSVPTSAPAQQTSPTTVPQVPATTTAPSIGDIVGGAIDGAGNLIGGLLGGNQGQ